MQKAKTLLFCGLMVFSPSFAYGQTFGRVQEELTAFFDDFSAISVGAAAIIQPKFIGASSTEVRFSPLLQATYTIDKTQQIYFKGAELGYAYAVNENFQFGANLTPRQGRNPNDDSRLAGIPDVDTAFELGPWVKGRWRGFRLEANLKTDISGQQDGVTALFRLSHLVEPFKGIRFKAYAQTEWASNSFADTFFTVTAAQATASRPAFNASSGFYQSALGGTFSHRLHEDVFLWADAKLQRLHGDAAKSSLTFRNTALRTTLGVGYTF